MTLLHKLIKLTAHVAAPNNTKFMAKTNIAIIKCVFSGI